VCQVVVSLSGTKKIMTFVDYCNCGWIVQPFGGGSSPPIRKSLEKFFQELHSQEIDGISRVVFNLEVDW